MPRVYNPKNGKIRNMLLKMGWTVGSAINTVQGRAIIAKGTCPGCNQKWTTEHRKCVPGLFPGETGQCTHRECGM